MKSSGVTLDFVGTITSGLGAPLQRTHLSVPTPWFDAATGRLRLFVSSRDTWGVSRVFVMELDPGNPVKVLASNPFPVLDVGRPGNFDADGILCTDVHLEADGVLRMLYAGFETGALGRYRLLTGTCVSVNGGETFNRESDTPLLPSRQGELSVRGAAVFGESLDSKFSGGIVYAGGSEWVATSGGRLRPKYALKYQTLANPGLGLGGGVRTLLEPDVGEHGFGRPGAIQTAGRSCLLLSVRVRTTGSYRLEAAGVTDQGGVLRGVIALEVWRNDTAMALEELMFAGSVTTGTDTWVFLNGRNYGEGGVIVTRVRNG